MPWAGILLGFQPNYQMNSKNRLKTENILAHGIAVGIINGIAVGLINAVR
jgi:hypothetical protein